MKILLINYEYPPVGGGAANATRHLAEALLRLGHHPVVVTTSFGSLCGRSVEKGVDILRVPSLRRRADRASLVEMAIYVFSAACALLTRRGRADGAIVFFSIPCGPLGLWIRILHGTRYVVSLRGGDVPGAEPSLRAIYSLLAPLRRMVFRRARAVVANSRGLADMAEKADPFSVEVIPNGVDTNFFKPASGSRAAGESCRVLFVGRFQEQKNPAFTLERLAAVHAAHPLEVTLVGDGPLRAELEEKARALNLPVAWRGWLDKNDLRREYHRADFLVNLSLYEGMPNVVMEAMACGLPVVVSEGPGHAELVRDGVTGFLCALDDAAGIERAMTRLAADGSLRQGLGQKASEDMRTRFTWENCALSYLRLLEQSNSAKK